MAKHKPKSDPYSTQAQNITTSRYGPEVSALAALLREAQDNRDTSLRQAKTGRQFTVGAVDQARPAINRAYQGAQAAITPAFAQGGGIEAQALTARMGESQALAQYQLQGRRVSAVEGEQAARVQANRDFSSDRAKIGQRATDLARESGAFTASTITDLIGQDAAAQADAAKTAASLGQQERNSQRSAGIDPDTGLPIPGGKLDPKAHPGSTKSPWASQEQHASASDEIARLLKDAKDFKSIGETRADVATTLASGAANIDKPIFTTVQIKKNGKVVGTKQQRVIWKAGEKDPATGKPVDPDKVGTQKTRHVPGVEKAKSQLLLVAALDMAYDGHLSRKTQKLLHDRKLQISQLGDLTTFGEWLKTPEGQAWRKNKRASKIPPQGGPYDANTQFHGHY